MTRWQEAMTESRRGTRRGGSIAAQASALQELDQVPLAARARAVILEAILQHQFAGRLPSEDDLAKMLNVSRTTVRAAVQDLQRDGLISRRRALGTRINDHVGSSTLALQRLVGFDFLLEEKGHRVRTEISWRRREVPVGVLPLSWEGPQDCCVIEKQYLADDVLAIYLRDYLPWSGFRDTDFEEPLEPSVFEFSKRYCNRPIDHAVVEIVPMASDERHPTKLGLGLGEPFIRLHETHYSEDAEAVGWSFVDFNDNYIRLEVFRGQ